MPRMTQMGSGRINISYLALQQYRKHNSQHQLKRRPDFMDEQGYELPLKLKTSPFIQLLRIPVTNTQHSPHANRPVSKALL